MAPGEGSVPTTASISKTCVSACWMYCGSCGREALVLTSQQNACQAWDITANTTFEKARLSRPLGRRMRGADVTGLLLSVRVKQTLVAYSRGRPMCSAATWAPWALGFLWQPFSSVATA